MAHFFFADDSLQPNPSRPGMGSLVAIGGALVAQGAVRDLEAAIDKLCSDAGFPPGEKFKWSPGPELWMHKNLADPERADFFAAVLDIAHEHGVRALVIIEDTKFKSATGAATPEMDVTRMFLERADSEFGRAGALGVVVVDRTGSDFKAEEKFLAEILETLQSGTTYSKPEHILLNVLSTPSKLIRLLQLADLIAGCTLSYVGGEANFAPTTFQHVQPILCRQWKQVGGIGVKIHPDFRYGNLYHWLFGDDSVWKGPVKTDLPVKGKPYARGPNDPTR